jgi:hypothetical protein
MHASDVVQRLGFKETVLEFTTDREGAFAVF